MTRQLTLLGVAVAVMFGIVIGFNIWLTVPHDNWPKTRDVVGCWRDGGLRVQLSEGRLAVGSTRVRTTGLQRVKQHSFLEAEPFKVVANEIRRTSAGAQPSWVDLDTSGPRVKRLRLIDAEFQTTPWLSKC